MSQTSQIKIIVDNLEEPGSDQICESRGGVGQRSLKLWLKAYFEAPAQVLNGEQKKDLLEVAKDFVSALEEELNEVEVNDMDDLFESEEVQKQRLKAILAAKCNKFTNKIWELQKTLQEEVLLLRESYQNGKKALSLQRKAFNSMSSKLCRAPSELQNTLKMLEDAKKKQKHSLKECEDWLKAIKEYPDQVAESLGVFLKEKHQKLLDKDSLKPSIDWEYFGEVASWPEGETPWLHELRDEIEIQYYLSYDYVFNLEVLSLKKAKFKNSGTKEYMWNDGEETKYDAVEPVRLKINRSDVFSVEYRARSRYAQQFSLAFLDKAGKELGVIGTAEGEVFTTPLDGRSLAFIESLQDESSGEIFSVAIGSFKEGI